MRHPTGKLPVEYRNPSGPWMLSWRVGLTAQGSLGGCVAKEALTSDVDADLRVEHVPGTP